MNSAQIFAVGEALLPYLREGVTYREVGTAAHDALAALYRSSKGLPEGLSDQQRLAIACGNEPYADDKVCPECKGLGYVSALKSPSLKTAESP